MQALCGPALFVFILATFFLSLIVIGDKQHYKRELAKVRETAQLEAQRLAKDRLLSELAYALDTHKLLAEPTAGVSEKWQKAFALLCTPPGPAFDAKTVQAQMVLLGFGENDAEYLVRMRATKPEYLIAPLVAVLSGIPEPQVWGVAHSI